MNTTPSSANPPGGRGEREAGFDPLPRQPALKATISITSGRFVAVLPLRVVRHACWPVEVRL